MKQLVEVAYFTDDVAGMSAFYQKLLGEPIAASEDMAIFMSGSTKIFIHKSYQADEGELPPENHFAYAVDDVDASCEELQAAGLTLEVAPKDYYWGRSAYLRDPDGHLIEINKPEEY
ncbi:MAG: VOC family protein [Chloroflexi bacterium]|nr:VOC family protein [Chloroflexota bacterium]